MRKKKLSALQKAKEEIRILKSQLESRQNSYDYANRELEALKLKIKTIQVKDFSLSELGSYGGGNFRTWQEQNPNVEIIKMEFVEVNSGNYRDTRLYILYK